MEEYKDMFLSEAREHLDDLNNLLVILEKTHDDKDTINKIFRNFHTLKGNSATMGYEVFSKLAHRLEDLLDLVRNGKMNVDEKVMDVLFKGCDSLEIGLKKIDGGVPESLNIKDIILKVDAVMIPTAQTNNNNTQKDNKEETNLKNNINIQPIVNNQKIILTKDEEKIISTLTNEEKNKLIHIEIIFEDNHLKAMKALSIIKKIEANQKNKIIRLNPTKEELNSIFKLTLEIIILAEKNEDIETIIKQVSKIKEYKIKNVFENIKKEQNETKIETKAEIKTEEPQKNKTEKVEIQTKKDTLIQTHTDELKKVQEVKIDIKRLDNLMDMVGELLIHKMRLEDINKGIASKELEEITNAISILTQNIQSEVIEERMIPVGLVFTRFPRIVRDLSHEEGKEIEFLMEGDDKKLDRTVVDKITDPLIHMIRNSIDHGVETPDEREKKGKPRKGTIKLTATREKNSVIIEVVDDGQGIDPVKIKAAAIKKKILPIDELNQMSEQKLQELVFLPGFSTNETITEISGRGVGMDVVMTNIKQVGGKVYLESKKDIGTKVKIELPLTLAIIKVLLVNIGEDKYAIPLNNIQEIIDLKREEIKTIQKKESFILRKETIALLRLKKLVGQLDDNKSKLTTIIVEDGIERIGIIVDSIESQQQILIKSVDEKIKKVKGIAGGTILGSGKVCFILDIDSLIKQK